MSAVLKSSVDVSTIPAARERAPGLYPHQVTGIEFLRAKGRAILADDMGLGKTRQAIVAMREATPTGVVLVVCPASLKLNWEREIRLVEPDAAVDVLGVAGHSSGAPRWVIVNYDLLRKHSDRLHAIQWSGVIVDEAHFIKNSSQRASHVLELLGVSETDKRQAVAGPRQVYLLTGTPMPNRPRDLYNLLRAVGHPAGRSFLSFARRYCGAYRNDYGWVTDGASNIDELNLLLKEVMLRRRKDEVLDLPPKIRSYVPVDASSAAAFTAQLGFVSWLSGRDASRQNDREFLGRLQKVRVALHKAKQAACAERIKDVLATGQKVVVFTCYTAGLKRHKATLGDTAVTISGDDDAEARMAAVDAFQNDPSVRVAICNLIAGGVGLTLTAGTHVIFQDLDWVPANHRQAEDRCYRLGQDRQVTVEYLLADGTLDGYIAKLLDAKIRLIDAVEADTVPDASILGELERELQALAPALLAEMQTTKAAPAEATRIQIIGEMVAALPDTSPIVQDGRWEFPSSKDPRKAYAVTFGRAGHLECSCPGFEYRGECKHVREVRGSVFK